MKTLQLYLGMIILIASYPLIFVISILNSLRRRFMRGNIFQIEKGDVAVITGAAHGLGKLYAEYLAKRGCNICVVDINGDLAQSVAEELQSKFQVKAKAYVTDVGKFEKVQQLYNQVKSDFGATTYLINNAGMLTFSDWVNPSPDEMLNMIHVNYAAHFWTTKVFLPDMKKQKKGHILAVSSISGLIVLPMADVYSSSKYAVRGLMRCLRHSLQAEGFSNITCTTVFPFFLNTNDIVKKAIAYTDTMNFLPLLKGDFIVKASMEAMLRGESEVTLMRIFSILYKLLELLPAESFDCINVSLHKINSTYGKWEKFGKTL